MKKVSFRLWKWFSQAGLTLAAISTTALQALAEEAHHAAAAGHHGPRWGELGLPVLNFLLYAALLYWVYQKKITHILRGRRTAIEQSINKAGADLEEAEEILKKVSADLRGFDERRAEIVRAAEEEGRLMSEALLTRTAEEAAQMERDTTAQRRSAFTSAESELKAELVEMALFRAKRDLARTMSPERDRELRRQLLRSLQS